MRADVREGGADWSRKELLATASISRVGSQKAQSLHKRNKVAAGCRFSATFLSAFLLGPFLRHLYLYKRLKSHTDRLPLRTRTAGALRTPTAAHSLSLTAVPMAPWHGSGRGQDGWLLRGQEVTAVASWLLLVSCCFSIAS